jgi:hypothetical protein
MKERGYQKRKMFIVHIVCVSAGRASTDKKRKYRVSSIEPTAVPEKGIN